MKKEVEKVLEELQGVRPENLNKEAKRLFDAIMSIADQRDELREEKKQLKQWLDGEIKKEHEISKHNLSGLPTNREKTLIEILNKIKELEGAKDENNN